MAAVGNAVIIIRINLSVSFVIFLRESLGLSDNITCLRLLLIHGKRKDNCTEPIIE